MVIWRSEDIHQHVKGTAPNTVPLPRILSKSYAAILVALVNEAPNPNISPATGSNAMGSIKDLPTLCIILKNEFCIWFPLVKHKSQQMVNLSLKLVVVYLVVEHKVFARKCNIKF